MSHHDDEEIDAALSAMNETGLAIDTTLNGHGAYADLAGMLPPLQALSLRELLSREIKPREMILPPWLPTQGLAMIHAKRGTGKTYVALGVAYAVATGGSFLRWKAKKPRRVLYIDGEMPEATIQERLARFVATDNERTNSDPPLQILTPDEVRGPMPNLASADGQDRIEPLLRDVELIVVDHISALCSAGRENDAESWNSVQEWALRMRARGISVLFIHHSGKGGLQRGTSRREDVLDSVLSLRQPAGYTPDQGACFEVHFEKNRGFYDTDARPFEARLLTGGNTQQWLTRDIAESTAEKVAALLDDGLKQTEIAEELGITRGAVSKAAKKARNLRLIKGGLDE